VLKSVFVLIKLLRSIIDAVNKDITECILYKVCKEVYKKDNDYEVYREEEEDYEVCKEVYKKDKECCNAVINEVRRFRIVLRS